MDLDLRSSSCGVGEREADLATCSSFPFSSGEAERQRDFLSTDISLDGLREPRSDFTFERLFERDLDFRSAEPDRDLRELERDLDLRERDLRLRDRDLLSPDLEREWPRLLLLREPDLKKTNLFSIIPAPKTYLQALYTQLIYVNTTTIILLRML